MVKGVMHPDDAAKAVDCGADAVIVSNHGGRNLDSSIAPLQALPAMVDRVGSRVPVLVDSGYRRGSDIVKALALGASAVLVGRATLYGTAAAGEAGATRAIDILRDEIGRVLALIGCNSIAELEPELLQYRRCAVCEVRAIRRRRRTRQRQVARGGVALVMASCNSRIQPSRTLVREAGWSRCCALYYRHGTLAG